MTISSGLMPASATPAQDAYDTVVSVLLTNAGWTHVEQVAFGTAGTTDDVEVWRNPNTDFYVFIEPAYSLQTMRFRYSLSYDIGTHTLSRPAHGGNFYTSYACGADGSFGNGTTYTINTATSVGYFIVIWQFTGSQYVAGVNSDSLVFGTRYNNNNYHTICSKFTSLATAFTDSSPIVAGGHHNSVSWQGSTNTRGWGKFLKDPGAANQTFVTPFACIPSWPSSPLQDYYMAAVPDGFGLGLAGGSQEDSDVYPSRHHTLPVATVAYLHNAFSATVNATVQITAAMRGYLSDFIIVPANEPLGTLASVGELPIGWQWTYGGETYHNLGICWSTVDGGTNEPCTYIAVKGSAY